MPLCCGERGNDANVLMPFGLPQCKTVCRGRAYRSPAYLTVCGLLLFLVVETCVALTVHVLTPKSGQEIIASITDGFHMDIFVAGLEDMNITSTNCGMWMVSIVDGESELFAGSLCPCYGDSGGALVSCQFHTVFDQPESANPIFEISVLDRYGTEVAHTTSRYQLVVRNDTGLRGLISSLQREQQEHEGSWKVMGGGDLAIAIDDLQWFSALFRHERRVFSQGGEDGVLEQVFSRFGTTNKVAVEFGTEEGCEVNSRRLWEEDGWRAILLDGSHENVSLHANASLFQHFITRDNIVEILQVRARPHVLLAAVCGQLAQVAAPGAPAL